jgi:hypothetical protein
MNATETPESDAKCIWLEDGEGHAREALLLEDARSMERRALQAEAKLAKAAEALTDAESWMRQIASKPNTVRDDDPVWRMGLLVATKVRKALAALNRIGKEAND